MTTSPNRRFEVNEAEYPFADHWLPVRDGFLHYVDEGSGPTVLLLHGNPTWSYLYRNIVKELRSSCRVIAPDYLGFGLSIAPTNFNFEPRSHAEVVKSFIEKLALKDILLVCQDWGGPIGMSYATQHRANIRGLVVMNTWAWEASVPQKLFSLVMGGWPLGYLRQNGRSSQSISGEVAGDFMFWPNGKHCFGWYLEPAYDYNFMAGHQQSIGISAGLLIGIHRKHS